MKVLLLAPQPYYSDRGTPMNVRTMLGVLSRAGIRVDLLTYPLGVDTPMEGLSVTRVPRPPLLRRIPIGPSFAKVVLDALMAPIAFRMARRGAYDLVHAIEESVYFGLLIKRRYGIPLLYDMDSSLREQLIHYGFARWRPVRGILSALEETAVKGSDGVITVCGALTGIAEAVKGHPPVHQIEDIPLEVARPAVPGDAEELESAVRGRSVLLYTGNFEHYQGLSLVIDALPAVVEKHPESLLVMVGGEGKRLEEMRREVERRGLGGSVLMTGARPPEEMGWFMDRADVLLSPRTKGTNTPLKIYTYLGSGRPVVATRLPTHTQVLDDSVAVLVEPRQAAFAEGIIGLLDDPGRGGELGAAGRKLVNERYSLPVFGEKLLAAYRQAAARGTPEKGGVGRPDGSPAVFLDRDGVVNRRLEGDYVKQWREFEFLPGAVEAIRLLKRAGYRVVVVTNQQGIGKGLMSESDLEELHRRMQEELTAAGAPLDGVYHCPHLEGEGCGCRKPEPGLLLNAARDLSLDLSVSFMAGDSPSDLEAGRRAGCRGVYIGAGQGAGDCPGFPDLLSFAAVVSGGGRVGGSPPPLPGKEE